MSEPDAAQAPEAPFNSLTPAVPGESVGTRIRQVRADRGWTQDQLASEVGVSRSAVAQWETDRAGQVRGNLTRIAEALGVSVEYLLHGTASRKPTGGETGDELALLRLYRVCDGEDRFVPAAHRA